MGDMNSRELDSQVAEMLGWTDLQDDAYTPSGQLLCGTPPAGLKPMWSTGRSAVPYFSTKIDDAWLVVTHLTSSDGPHADLKWSFGLEYSTVIDWVADFTPRRNHPKARDYPAFQAGGSSATEAICRAALAALKEQA